MDKKNVLLMIILLTCNSLDAFADNNTAQSINKATELAKQEKYEDALRILTEEESKNPKEFDLLIAQVRIFSWMGNYTKAEQVLGKLGEGKDKNVDVILLKANLAYYKHEYTDAIKLYQEVLKTAPNYNDAKIGLAQTQKAQVNIATPSDAYKWQIDLGYEHSSFSRVPQSEWNQEMLQITHFMDQNKTAVYGKINLYDRFKQTDYEYEAGITHIFKDYLNGYTLAALSPDPDFRPESKIAAGGAFRAIGREYLPTPLWITLDSQYDTYSTTRIITNIPGVRLELPYGWSISSRMIAVKPTNAQLLYGRDLRIGGVVNDRLNFYAGYANAPETVDAVTVRTISYFGGLALNVRPDTILRIGYSHDDRENSYIRQGVNCIVSYRF
jgi:tetratricopeptide (TPR) repeat protein